MPITQTIDIQKIEVKNIRKTKAGDFLMTMANGNVKMEELQNKLDLKLGSENFQIGGEWKNTFIKNID